MQEMPLRGRQKNRQFPNHIPMYFKKVAPQALTTTYSTSIKST